MAKLGIPSTAKVGSWTPRPPEKDALPEQDPRPVLFQVMLAAAKERLGDEGFAEIIADNAPAKKQPFVFSDAVMASVFTKAFGLKVEVADGGWTIQIDDESVVNAFLSKIGVDIPPTVG